MTVAHHFPDAPPLNPDTLSVRSVTFAHRDGSVSIRNQMMGKKLYVGNLSYEITDADLQTIFGVHGTVQSAQVIMDREAGRSKGFGFVEMGSDQESQNAIKAIGGQQSGGRALTVNEAKSQENRGGRGPRCASAGHGGGGRC